MTVTKPGRRPKCGGRTAAFAAILIVMISAGCGPQPQQTLTPPPRPRPQIMYVGGELASVNVGLAEGVQMGMVLEVRRKGAVVARLRVAEVSAHAAAGIVLGGSVRPNDEVVVPPAAGTPATGPATTRPAKTISATITAVNEGVAGIDAGSAGGVRAGMVFVVFRGDEFIAHLRILAVGSATSEAMVYDMVRRPVPGDRAMSMGW